MLNNADRLENGNSAIDELIALSTLNGSQGMYGGGSVQKMPQSGYMKEGGVAKNLKEIPEDNPGLAKLPDMVRNRMGYMQEGGMAYIDPSDSTIVTKNSEQSELFDVLKNSISFAPGTTNKYALETFIDMLNNPNSYNRLDKDKDRANLPRIKSDDPLEIDMRMRSGNVQAIGIARPSSEKGILKELDRMQGDIGLLKIMRDRYKPSSFNEYRRMKEKSGDVMTMEEMMDVLNRAGGMTRDKFKIPEMQNGGSTYTYGSGQTEMPNIADVYEAAGYMPTDEQLEKFQSQFLYDPSREEASVASYLSNVANVSSQAGSALGRARSSSQGAGSGFVGFGERERLISEAGSRVQEQGIRGLESAQRRLFEDIRNQRETYLQEAGQALSELEGAGEGGAYTANLMGVGGGISSPPGYTGGQPQEGQYFTGTNNIRYVYSNGSWRQG